MNAYLSRFFTEQESAGLTVPADMPTKQMLALYDALRVLHGIALGYAGNHRFINEQGVYNHAGGFMDDLVDLIGKASDRVAEAAAAARPADDIELSELAEIMLRHEIACEGAGEAAVLAAGIYGTRGEAA